MGHLRTWLDGFVHNLFQFDHFARPCCTVHCYNHFCSGIIYSISECTRGKSSKNDSVRRTYSRARHHCCARNYRAWEVDNHCITCSNVSLPGFQTEPIRNDICADQWEFSISCKTPLKIGHWKVCKQDCEIRRKWLFPRYQDHRLPK